MPIFDLVGNAFFHGAPQRRQHAFAIVRVNLALVALECSVERAGRKTVDLLEVVRPSAPVCDDSIPLPRAHQGGIEREPQTLLAASGVVLGARALDGEGHLRGYHAGKLQLVAARRPGCSVVQPELADDAAEADERDARHRRDAFVRHRRKKRIRATACP